MRMASTWLGLIFSTALIAPPVLAGPQGPSLRALGGPGDRQEDLVGSVQLEKGLVATPLHNHTCAVMTMSCNSTVNGALTDHDCDLSDGTFVDFWEFDGTAGSEVTVDLTSSAFDTYSLSTRPCP